MTNLLETRLQHCCCNWPEPHVQWLQGEGSLNSICMAYIVVEVPIQAQNVWMSQMRLNLDFSAELMLHVGVSQLVLEQHLNMIRSLVVVSSLQISALLTVNRQGYEGLKQPLDRAVVLSSEQGIGGCMPMNMQSQLEMHVYACLQSNYELCLPFPSQIYVSKLATPKRLANIKVSELPPPIFVHVLRRISVACSSNRSVLHRGPGGLSCISCRQLKGAGRWWAHSLCRSSWCMLRLRKLVGRLKRSSVAGCLAELCLLFCWL